MEDFVFNPDLLTADGQALPSGGSSFDWGGALGTLGQFAGTAASVFTSVTNSKAQRDLAKANARARNQVTTATGNSFAKYLPWILGVVALVLGAVLLRRK